MELWNWKNFVGAVESAVVINTGLNSSTSIKVPASSWGLWPIKRIFNLQNGKTGIKSLGGRHNYQGRNIQIWSGKVKKENSKTAITIESQTHHFQPLISMFSISGLCWNADKLIWLISSRVLTLSQPLLSNSFSAHTILSNSWWIQLFQQLLEIPPDKACCRTWTNCEHNFRLVFQGNPVCRSHIYRKHVKFLPANSVPLWRKFLEIAALWLYFNTLSTLVYGLDPWHWSIAPCRVFIS